jgi:hypothetical protein
MDLLRSVFMKICISFIAALFLSHAAEAATVKTDTPQYTASIGELFTVDIVGTDFPLTQGGGFNLSYDANILNVTHVSIDEINTWTFVNDAGTIDNVNGVLNDVVVSDFPGIAGDFTVASIEFIAVGLGQSGLNLTESVINPWASDGNIISPLVHNNGSVQVVPIPTSIVLLGSGLLSLIGASCTRVRGFTVAHRTSHNSEESMALRS